MCRSRHLLFVADRDSHCVHICKLSFVLPKYPAVDLLMTIGREGSQDGQFDQPTGVAASDRLQLLIVADTNNHRVQGFHFKGKHQFSISTGEGSFPHDVTFLNDGDLFAVSLPTAGKILVYESRQGSPVVGHYPPDRPACRPDASVSSVAALSKLSARAAHFIPRQSSPSPPPAVLGGRFRPYGLSSDSHGRLFVTDLLGNSLTVVNPDLTTHVTRFGYGYSCTDEDGQVTTRHLLFNRPTAVTVDRLDSVYVADSHNHLLVQFPAWGPCQPSEAQGALAASYTVPVNFSKVQRGDTTRPVLTSLCLDNYGWLMTTVSCNDATDHSQEGDSAILAFPPLRWQAE